MKRPIKKVIVTTGTIQEEEQIGNEGECRLQGPVKKSERDLTRWV